MRLILLMVWLGLGIVGCQTDLDFKPFPPKVSFLVKNNNCKAPCAVNFVNTTKVLSETTYQWDFGDSTTSKLENPQKAYFTDGTFLVRLTAKNAQGTSFAEQFVTVERDLSIASYNRCRIQNVKITKMPFTRPDSTNWDNGTGLDIYPDLSWQLRDVTATSIIQRNEDYPACVNVNPGSMPLYMPPIPRTRAMTDLDASYKFFIYDIDSDTEEVIFQLNFRPIDYFPAEPGKDQSSVIRLTRDGFIIDIELTWFVG